MDPDLKKLSKLISQKLNRKLTIKKIEKIGSGYHSDGFKLILENGRPLFLKKLKSYDLGFEYPERRISSLLISHSMAKRIKFSPQPIGIILENKNESFVIPEISEETRVYQVQELEKEGVDYWTLLQLKKNKKQIDGEDLQELSKIIDYITRVHNIKHPFTDKNRLRAVYNDAIRSVLTHPELTLMFLSEFPKNHPIFPLQKQREYLKLAWNLLMKWKDRCDRLTALHGDFWGANFFFKKDKSTWVIDYSRIPWGDPGIDIGWWFGQYLWFYHETKNEYFKKLGEKFLELYIQKTKDKEIIKASSLAMIFLGVIYITPRFHPDLDIKIGKRFFKNVIEIIKNNKILWII